MIRWSQRDRFRAALAVLLDLRRFNIWPMDERRKQQTGIADVRQVPAARKMLSLSLSLSLSSVNYVQVSSV